MLGHFVNLSFCQRAILNCDSRRAMYGETFFNDVKLTVNMLSVVRLSVLMQCGVRLSVVMLRVVM